MRALLGQDPFLRVGMQVEQPLADGQVEDRVAEELEPLVRFSPAVGLIEIGRVGGGAGEDPGDREVMAEHPFQLLQPFLLQLRGGIGLPSTEPLPDHFPPIISRISPSASEALWPPNPNEFVNAALTSPSRMVLGT